MSKGRQEQLIYAIKSGLAHRHFEKLPPQLRNSQAELAKVVSYKKACKLVDGFEVNMEARGVNLGPEFK